jgi:fibronectin type 3 domain-containing protein
LKNVEMKFEKCFPHRGQSNRSNQKTNLLTRLPLMAVVALLAMAVLARASISVYEPFNYSAGTLANGTAATGNGLSGTWTCGAAGTIGAGLTYPGLPAANNALSSGAGRQFVNFSSPLSSGTKWISFLFQASGNMGGNIDGVFFPNGNATCLWLGFGLAPYSPTQGQLGIGSMITAGTAVQGATSLQQLGLGNYASTYLVVMRIDFNTSGANDTITVYTNPVANAAAPGVSAAGTYSSYDVGTISGVGLNVQGGANITVDEIRVGDTYGDVVGYVGTPPGAPTGLGATPGANSVTLTWSAASGAPNSYNIKRSTTSGSGYTTVGSTTAPTVTFTDSVLGGQTYYYVVTAVNGGGESSSSSEVSASPTLAAPAAPTGLTATPGNAQAALSWTASSFATSYNVKRATASAGPYTTIGTTTAPTVTYTDASGLNNGTTYYYVVSASGDGGTSSDSSFVSATPAAAAPVYEPFNYSAGTLANGTAATGSGLSGNWTCGAAGTIGAGLTYPGLPVANNALSSGAGRQFVSFSSPLSSGTKWVSFLFQASGNMGGNIDGVFFPNGNATCLWLGFGLGPYSTTQGQLGIGSMTTAGTAVQGATALQQLGLGNYASTYLVVLKIDFNTAGANDTINIYTNPVANAAAPGVAAAGTYSSYDVGTISGIGLNVQGGANITVDEIRVGDTYGDVVGFVSIPPAAPAGLTATSGTNSVTLTWTAASGSPNSYNIKRSTTSGTGYTTVGTTTVPTVSFTDSVLGGQTYYYVVTASNGGGESSPSSEVSASPILAAPAAPAGLMATPGNAQVALSWAASSFATSYTVKRASASAGPYTIIGTTAGATYTDASGLSNGATYYYVVSASGAGGTSSDSSPVSATPNGPMPLIATVARGVGIRWFASNSVTYQVQWCSAPPTTNTLWNNLGTPIAGNGTTNTVFDPVGSPHNFYQVIGIQ